MTAQAGAVAELTIGTHEHDWGIAPSPAMYRLPAGEYSLYPTPPAAVPVEALEGLVAELRNEAAAIAKPYGFVTEHVIGKAEGLESCAERIEQLIKERSNG